ncbi:MAG: SDR family NAD(P)-dependent oxidoreductase, partial [Methylohalobius sp.]
MAASKTLLITGVSKGLGRALAEEFLTQGHRVLGCSRNVKAVEEL